MATATALNSENCAELLAIAAPAANWPRDRSEEVTLTSRTE